MRNNLSNKIYLFVSRWLTITENIKKFDFLIRIIPCFRRKNFSNWTVRSKKKIIRRSVNRVIIFFLELFVKSVVSQPFLLKFYPFIVASLIDIKVKNRFSLSSDALRPNAQHALKHSVCRYHGFLLCTFLCASHFSDCPSLSLWLISPIYLSLWYARA